MEHLLFALYIILFAWLITKIKFFRNSGLTSSQLIILFLIKILAGIIYGWIGVYYGELAQMVDTWFYHFESVKEYQLLLSHPADFFHDLFQNTYDQGYTRFLASEKSWWNSLKSNSIIMVLSLFNVLSSGQYYTNVIFYSFISLFGPVALYRVMQDIYPTRKIAVFIASFFIPSFLYWTSGLHKEGLIFLGLALILYQIYFSFKQKKISFPGILTLIAGFILVLALRNFLIVVLLPAVGAWLLCHKLKYRPVIVYSAIYAVFILLFFSTRYLHPRLNFPDAVVARQQAFIKLTGSSSVSVRELQPTAKSFVLNIPQALSLSIIRPYPSDVRHLLSLAAAVEINLLLLLFLAFLFWRKSDSKISPALLFCLFFSFGLLMMIGYSVNNLGAIVRYRSIVLPFLIVPMIANIDWEKISLLLFGNIKNNTNI